MPLQTPARPRKPLTPELALPPPFTPVRLRELGDAFAHAKSIAAEQGAGTLVYVGRFDLAEFAVVLEPEEPLTLARRAFYAGMAALADALVAHAQPETEIAIRWPDSILVNQGLVGGGRLGWPQGIREDETPPWLVFGAMIRTVSMTGTEPGLNPLVTALEEEGFSDVLSNHVLESFARHFMVAIDSWKESGFSAVAKSYLARLPVESGLRRDIDDNGDLLVRRMGQGKVEPEVERKALLPMLAKPGWLDPASKGPRS
jgi:biotin-(acetyl-CoA carboxylase) ligase